MLENFSICIIDDQIPVQKDKILIKERLLNTSNLESLLLGDDWDEVALQALVKRLVDIKCDIRAVKHPAHFLNYLESDNYRADIIIYDWDNGADPQEALTKILQSAFSLVIIYTKEGKKTEANNFKTSLPKEIYDKRLDIIFKEDENSVEKLISMAEEMCKNNFSFKFGKELRNHTIKSLDKILVEFGKIDLKEFVQLFGKKEQNDLKLISNDLIHIITEQMYNHLLENDNLKIHLRDHLNDEDIKQLICFIIEKLKNDLSDISIDLKPVNAGLSVSIDNNTIKQLWSYRLYYTPEDDIVRQGDIIYYKNVPDEKKYEKMYIVITGECDLAKVWEKNYGYISLVPILQISSNENFRSKLQLRQNIKKYKFEPSSFTHTPDGFPDGHTILPFIKIPSSFEDYISFPKEITTRKMKHSMDGLNKILKYVDDNPFSRLCSISKPFSYPLIQLFISNISGYGTPDYHNKVKNLINKLE